MMNDQPFFPLDGYFVLDGTIYLTPKQLSDWQGGSPTVGALANMRSKCEGPRFIRLGRLIFYSLEDVKAWQERQQKQGKKKPK